MDAIECELGTFDGKSPSPMVNKNIPTMTNYTTRQNQNKCLKLDFALVSVSLQFDVILVWQHVYLIIMRCISKIFLNNKTNYSGSFVKVHLEILWKMNCFNSHYGK